MFYLRPAAKVPADPTVPWYERAPVGKENLRTFVATMYQEAGIASKTNRSLRATGATALFNTNVRKEMIRDVTGHHSNSLQLYECPPLQHKQATSSILVQGEPTYVRERWLCHVQHRCQMCMRKFVALIAQLHGCGLSW